MKSKNHLFTWAVLQGPEQPQVEVGLALGVSSLSWAEWHIPQLVKQDFGIATMRLVHTIRLSRILHI